MEVFEFIGQVLKTPIGGTWHKYAFQWGLIYLLISTTFRLLFRDKTADRIGFYLYCVFGVLYTLKYILITGGG